MVCHVANKLGMPATKYIIGENMNKVIEAEFLRQKSDHELPQPNEIVGAPIKEKRRILIVDNDRESTHLVKILLERTGGYLVREENDATRAYRTARDFKPDLILLDIVMPERDGGEIAAQIQVDSKLQRTPIIFLTALVTKSEAEAGLQIQGHPFLAKPINVPDLIKAIEQNLVMHAAA